jgi:hypothetical protein
MGGEGCRDREQIARSSNCAQPESALVTMLADSEGGRGRDL